MNQFYSARSDGIVRDAFFLALKDPVAPSMPARAEVNTNQIDKKHVGCFYQRPNNRSMHVVAAKHQFILELPHSRF